MSNALNVIAFQAGWFASILLAASGWPWAAMLAALAVVALHLARARDGRAELKLVLGAGAIGLLWENALSAAGWTGFPGGVLLPGSAPLWMIAQWMMFATTLNQSLAWLKNRPEVAVVFGLFGGPLSYMAGERLGAIMLLDRDPALLALACGWALLTPLLLALAKRWNGFLPAARETSIPGAQHA